MPVMRERVDARREMSCVHDARFGGIMRNQNSRGLKCSKCGEPRTDYSATYCRECYVNSRSAVDFPDLRRLTGFITTPDGCQTRFSFHSDMHDEKEFESESGRSFC